MLEELCDLQYDATRHSLARHLRPVRRVAGPPVDGRGRMGRLRPQLAPVPRHDVRGRPSSVRPPVAVESRLRAAIDLAIAGEPPDRVSPQYSNIALMRAWLEEDEGFAAAVVDSYDEHGAFDEYNSPTYYGIDLYAISLWRTFPVADASRPGVTSCGPRCGTTSPAGGIPGCATSAVRTAAATGWT